MERAVNMYPTLSEDTTLNLSPKESIIWKLDTPHCYLNPIGAEILELCDGKHNIDEISKILAQRHDDHLSKVYGLVAKFLRESEKKGHVVFHNISPESHGTILGSREYFVPVDVSLTLTQRCDLMCKHCYVNAGKNLEEVLSTVEILKILNSVYDNGTRKIVLTGGDPFVRKDFLKILKFCSQKFLVVDISTNGYNIDSKLTSEIVDISKSGCCKFTASISLDGKLETHDSIRGVKGSWERAVKSAKLLSPHIPVSFTMTLNPKNLMEIEDVIKVAKKSGVRRLKVGMTISAGRAEGKNLELTKEQKNKANAMLIELSKKYTDENFYVKPWFESFETEVTLSDERKNCGAGYNMIAIDVYGNVKICLAFEYSIGNIFKTDLKQIYMSPLIDFFYQLKCPNKEMCGECQNFHICTACHAAAFVKSKNMDNCPWAIQWEKLPEAYKNPFK
ncbi:MAG: PqqD family peptide modification chaperone [Candidatus Methanoperedens sp.]|nr:PqqD family peptide modification chaperone [Candidatus Methanoperedens sp.]